jgi:hypothetical protein
MRLSSLSLPELFQVVSRSICCLGLVVGTVPATINEPFLSKPPQEWTETEALQVLNDSPWAHTVKTTTQDFQCNYENPAFPGLSSDESAHRLESMMPTPAATTVASDGAEYLVRLISVKPIQAAANRLISLDEKWAAYGKGSLHLQPGDKPTNLSERYYNMADEIVVAVILKHRGPGGVSFLDYAFGTDDGRTTFPGPRLRRLWDCVAIKTEVGPVHGLMAGMGFGRDDRVSGILVSFPSVANGKPLISHPNEKLVFRFIADQRVFETTFVVSPADLLDGTEKFLRIPFLVDESTPATDP